MTRREKHPADRGPEDDFDSVRRARERKWFIGVLLALGLVVVSLSFVFYGNHRAKVAADQAEHARLVQYQAKLVAQVKVEITDEAYRGFRDRFPDVLSPVLHWDTKNINARTIIEYELFPSETGGVIHHLYNTPAEREALVRHLERIWGEPWDKIREAMLKRDEQERQESDAMVRRLRQQGKL